MKLTGIIKKICDVNNVSESFKKQTIVVVTEDQYPQSIPIEFTQDRISLLSEFKEGDKVDVSIDIKGREWTNNNGETKYFVNINGWKISKFGGQVEEKSFETNNEPGDDLPF